MDRESVLMSLAVKACLAANPALRHEDGHWKEKLKDAIHYVLNCQVSGSRFSETEPTYPIIRLKCGKFTGKYDVLPSKAVSSILGPMVHLLGNKPEERHACLQALLKVLAVDGARVEEMVRQAADKLLNDPVRVQRKKDQVEREKKAVYEKQVATMRREMRFWVKFGFSEEDVVRLYRECLLEAVQES